MPLPFNITPASILSNIDFLFDALNIGLKIDVVGIYGAAGLDQQFPEARPVKAVVREYQQIMQYPVETGVRLSDHRVIMPTQIEMMLVVPARFYGSTYQQIKAAFTNASLLSVQTRTGVYSNMVIAEMPHQEDPEMYDAVMMSLRLQEVLFAVPASLAQPNAPANYSPTDPQNQSTIPRGLVSKLAVTVPSAVLGYIQSAKAWGR